MLEHLDAITANSDNDVVALFDEMQTLQILDHPSAMDAPTTKRFIVEALGVHRQLFDMVLPVCMTEEQQIQEAQGVIDLKHPGWTVTSLFIETKATPF